MPVVVLGRTYTIHDDILNSNLPSILREQGALAIPVDAFPVRDDAPNHGLEFLSAAARRSVPAATDPDGEPRRRTDSTTSPRRSRRITARRSRLPPGPRRR